MNILRNNTSVRSKGKFCPSHNVPAEKWEKEFIEKGAAIEHSRWARWQAYMHSKFVEHSDGKGEFVCLPVELYRRWERQISTPYSELSEQEKESDREQVRPYIPLVREAISEAVEEERRYISSKVVDTLTTVWAPKTEEEKTIVQDV